MTFDPREDRCAQDGCQHVPSMHPAALALTRGPACRARNCLCTGWRSMTAAEKMAWAMPERGHGGLQEAVDNVLRPAGTAGRIWWHHAWMSKNSNRGLPDTLAIGATFGIAAELKQMGEDPTPEQRTGLEAFARMGFRVYVWRPDDWLEGRIQPVLAELIYGTGARAVA